MSSVYRMGKDASPEEAGYSALDVVISPSRQKLDQ
jgi:hypothetical protein